MLLHSTALTEHAILASTMDTAIGEALDKIGRMVLPAHRLAEITDTAYAKHLTQYAFKDAAEYSAYELPKKRGDEIRKKPNKFGWAVQSPFAETKELAFSFSGIASRIQALFEERQAAVEGGVSDEERILFARTALGTAFEHLASRTIIAIERVIEEHTDSPHLLIRKPKLRTLVVSGGVAANDFLRHVLREMLNSRGLDLIEIVSPPVQLCTDNAAMIGWCGIEMYEEGWRSSLAVDPLRTWSMDTDGDGNSGIISVSGWTKARKRMSVDEWFARRLSHEQIRTNFNAMKLRPQNSFNSVNQKTLLERLDKSRPGERPE
jgi:N6-L-threonylcarbamoyladenine synthase